MPRGHLQRRTLPPWYPPGDEPDLFNSANDDLSTVGARHVAREHDLEGRRRESHRHPLPQDQGHGLQLRPSTSPPRPGSVACCRGSSRPCRGSVAALSRLCRDSSRLCRGSLRPRRGSVAARRGSVAARCGRVAAPLRLVAGVSRLSRSCRAAVARCRAGVAECRRYVAKKSPAVALLLRGVAGCCRCRVPSFSCQNRDMYLDTHRRGGVVVACGGQPDARSMMTYLTVLRRHLGSRAIRVEGPPPHPTGR